MELAKRPGMEGSLRVFLMEPHPPMPPISLSTQQIEDIIAFTKTFSTAPVRQPSSP